jgi:hypothetical protein
MLSSKWSWVERARAWDSHIQAERDKVAAAEARKWERRRLAAREANFGLAEKLQERVQKLLEMPTVQKRSTVMGDDGRTTVTVWEPARWAQRDLATMAKIASDLGEVALYSLEERNARQIVASVTTKSEASIEDALSRLSADELDAYECLTRKMLGRDPARPDSGVDPASEAKA